MDDTVAARAAPMSIEARRAALVGCTMELVLEHGTSVTTRQIAEAAGVAEGTIFRVFPSKDELVAEAVRQAFDPAPMLARLAAIKANSLQECLMRMVEHIQLGLTRIFHLIGSAGGARPSRDILEERASRQGQALAVIATRLEPYRSELRYPLPVVARQLWLSAFAGSHPATVGDSPLAPAEIVDFVLHGVGRTPGETSC